MLRREIVTTAVSPVLLGTHPGRSSGYVVDPAKIRKFRNFRKAIYTHLPLFQNWLTVLSNIGAERRKRWSFGWARGAVVVSWPE